MFWNGGRWVDERAARRLSDTDHSRGPGVRPYWRHWFKRAWGDAHARLGGVVPFWAIVIGLQVSEVLVGLSQAKPLTLTDVWPIAAALGLWALVLGYHVLVAPGRLADEADAISAARARDYLEELAALRAKPSKSRRPFRVTLTYPSGARRVYSLPSEATVDQMNAIRSYGSDTDEAARLKGPSAVTPEPP